MEHNKNETKEVRYAIPMDLMEMVVGYLGSQKYSDVRPIIGRLEKEIIKVDLPINNEEKDQS